MKKNYLIVLLLLLGAVFITKNTFAGSAYPYPVKTNQPDGTVLTVILHGDENLSWAKTIDGYTLLFNNEGVYEYAMLNSSGDLTLSGQKAHEIPERTIAALKFSGLWTNSSFNKKSQQLLTILNKEKIQVTGTVFTMRYSSPFTPWFLRRNEVAIEIIFN